MIMSCAATRSHDIPSDSHRGSGLAVSVSIVVRTETAWSGGGCAVAGRWPTERPGERAAAATPIPSGAENRANSLILEIIKWPGR
jgi:hypothetical protein